MKKIIGISLFSFALLLAGCGGNNKNSAPQDSIQAEGTHEKHSDQHSKDEDNAGKVTLNNGQKWEANAETTQGIQKMQTMVTEYQEKSDTDHQALSENLDKEFNSILQKCTMTGEAHNQLHNYLLPLKSKIAQLKEDTKPGIVKDIQDYLANYNSYFQ